MYDLQAAVRAAIKDCGGLRDRHRTPADQRVILTAMSYAEAALQSNDALKMTLAFEMVDQIKAARRPADVLNGGAK
jgi:hypothetical protein